MTPIDPRSASEIIRASAILLIQLLRLQPGPWVQSGPYASRQVTLRVLVKEVLKGEVPAGEVQLEVKQVTAEVPMDAPTLWSQVPLEEGVQLVAFCKGASRDPAVLLRDEAGCEQLLPVHPALEDVQAAVAAEAGEAGHAGIASEAWAQRAARGTVYARWLWDRLAPEALRAAPGLEPLARLIEDAETAQPAREALIQAVYQGLQEAPSPVPRQKQRLVRALLKAAQLPGAQAMRRNLEGVLLRNLLRLDRGPGAPPAAEVFHHHADERKAALASVRAEPASVDRDRLLQWLQVGAPR